MKIAIIGGGLTGLAAADVLAEKHKVFVYEKSSFLGGLAGSFKHKGKKIPLYYHHVFNQDKVTRKFLKRFALKSVWKRIEMAILVGGNKYEFTNLKGLMNFDYLSFWGKIRYGLFGLYVYTVLTPNEIKDDLDAYTWLKRVAGKEVTRKLFVPLYARNKFGIPLKRISARQFANRLKAKEATGLFGYPVKGLDRLVEDLEWSLKQRKVKIFKNFNLKEITSNAVNGKKFDRIIVTIPVPEFLNVVKNFEDKERLSRIKYCPCVSVVFGTDKFLGKHYWLNVLNERIHMIMQHSKLFDKYDTKVSWALRYGRSGEDFKLKKDEIAKEYLEVVRKYFPNVQVSWWKVFKEKYASPIYDSDYFKNMPKRRYDKVYFAGIVMSYPKIRNMNTALIEGIKVGRMVLEEHK